MSLSIGKYIYHALSGVTGVTSISPLFARSGSTEYIVYKRKNESPEYTRDGVAYNTTSMQIDIVNSCYEDSLDVAEQVRAALENRSGQYKNVVVRSSELSSADEQTDGNLWIQTLNFDFITD